MKSKKNDYFDRYAKVDLCIWQDENLSLVEKSIYTYLCVQLVIRERAPQGIIQLVADKLKYDIDTVYAALRTLQKYGYIHTPTLMHVGRTDQINIRLIGECTQISRCPDA